MLQDVSTEPVHATPYARPMCHEEHEYLLHVFEYEIRQLERVLDWDCSMWRKRRFSGWLRKR